MVHFQNQGGSENTNRGIVCCLTFIDFLFDHGFGSTNVLDCVSWLVLSERCLVRFLLRRKRQKTDGGGDFESVAGTIKRFRTNLLMETGKFFQFLTQTSHWLWKATFYLRRECLMSLL